MVCKVTIFFRIIQVKFTDNFDGLFISALLDVDFGQRFGEEVLVVLVLLPVVGDEALGVYVYLFLQHDAALGLVLDEVVDEFEVAPGLRGGVGFGVVHL